jgi:TonB-dependent starch-binding outer membrane protein SusC
MTMSKRSFLVLTPGLIWASMAGCAHGGGEGDGGAAAPAGLDTPGGVVVSADDIQRTPSEPIERTLMRRFPGVWVARTPEGGLSVRIRGATSINSSTEPLYVIDGIATQPGPNGSLTGVQAQDIETIQVLKDAASTAMYGVRGANGVIVIKTKQAKY